MASIIKFSIDLNKLDKNKIKETKRGGKYYPMTLTINDEVDQYGNQGPVITELSKEEREGGVEKTYLGNAKVVWTNGQNVDKAPYVEQGSAAPAEAMQPAEDDLPF